jgi:hypothetical protein
MDQNRSRCLLCHFTLNIDVRLTAFPRVLMVNPGMFSLKRVHQSGSSRFLNHFRSTSTAVRPDDVPTVVGAKIEKLWISSFVPAVLLLVGKSG